MIDSQSLQQTIECRHVEALEWQIEHVSEPRSSCRYVSAFASIICTACAESLAANHWLCDCATLVGSVGLTRFDRLNKITLHYITLQNRYLAAGSAVAERRGQSSYTIF